MRDGLGPYLSIYLLLTHHWDQGSIGFVMAGRFNISLGAGAAATGVGASVSNLVAGSIVVAAGYDVAFVSLGAVAGLGFALYLIAMPETAANVTNTTV